MDLLTYLLTQLNTRLQYDTYILRHSWIWPDGYGATVLRGVPVYFPAIAGTHYAYARKDRQAAQAKSTWTTALAYWSIN